MIKIRAILALSVYLNVKQAIATTLENFSVLNNQYQSIIVLKFKDKPVYTLFLLHKPERVVLDILQSSITQVVVFSFNNADLIKRVYTGSPLHTSSTRLIVDLSYKSCVNTAVQYIEKYYNLLVIITSQKQVVSPSTNKITRLTSCSNKFKKEAQDKTFYTMTQTAINAIPLADQLNHKLVVHQITKIGPRKNKPIIVAIDAGHGGYDPGAIGIMGLYEKNITISIARKLKRILNKDEMFKAVLTREGDYFVSVMKRSIIAREKGANVLLSIHTDSSLNHSISGASVWVLPSQRTNNKTSDSTIQKKYRFQLKQKTGNLLSKMQTTPHLNQIALDMQLGTPQKEGRDIAIQIINQLRYVVSLHKNKPEYASFGVLRSSVVPSILVEAGFISNLKQEKLLSSDDYQNRIASALRAGLRTYYLSVKP